MTSVGAINPGESNSDLSPDIGERRIGLAELAEARELALPAPMPELPDRNAIHAALKPGEKLYFWVNQFQFLMVIGLFGLGLKVGWIVVTKVSSVLAPSVLAGINARRLGLLIALGGVVVAIVVAIVFFTRRGNKTVSSSLPEITNPAFRLRLIGKEEHAKAIADALTPDANFEPVIVRLWYGHARESEKPNKHGFPQFFHQGGVSPQIWTFSALLAVGAMVIASWVSNWRLIKFDVWTMWAGMGLITLIATWIKPSYLRIAPGRLDVMEFGSFGLGTVKCDTYDLRKARIAINLPVGVARIEDVVERGGEQHARVEKMPTLHIRPAMLSNDSTKYLSHRADPVWIALLNAARTDVPTPPLPDDELLG